MSLEKKVREKLKKVIDPELGYNIVDLGLIYEIKISKKKAKIKMTLTSPACPIGPILKAYAEQAASKAEGIESATVDIVFNPVWSPKKATEEIQEAFAQFM